MPAPVLPLKSLEIQPWETKSEGFPWNLEVLRQSGKIEFPDPVTILCGDNGSGKSSLLELVAAAAGLPAIGYHSVEEDPTLAAIKKLLPQVKLIWTRKPGRGFFLRAEDFFGFARRISQMTSELQDDLARAERETAGRSIMAQQYATMSYKGQLAALRSRYGAGLDAQSHGESFLLLFRERIVPGGFYLLDEPEAPLSPLRQLGLLSLLSESVARGSQFLIATHSPILMAYPGAQILEFTQRIQRTQFDQLESVTLLRDFLNQPQVFLRHIDGGGLE